MSKKKKIIIFIILLIIIIVLSTLTVLVLKDKSNNKTNKEDSSINIKRFTSNTNLSDIDIEKEDELSEKIEILDIKYKDEYLYILAENKNNIDVYYTISINYLDENGVRVDKKFSSDYVSKGKKFVLDIWDKTDEKYNSVKITVETQKLRSYQHMENLELSDFEVNETDDGISLKLLKASDKDLSLLLSIIYYKDNEIIFYDKAYGFVQLDEGENGDVMFYSYRIPNQEYGKEKVYDKYDIIISSVRYDDKDY